MSQPDGQRAASSLRDSERKFQTLLYNLPERVFHKDRQSVYVSCNRNYAADFGLEPEQMVGKTDADLFPAEIAAKYRADDERVMDSGCTVEFEETYRTGAGDERVIRTVKAPLRDEHGQVVGILGIFSDITERKRAEQALQQAHVELEQRVAARTAELSAANQHLEREVEARARIETALRASEARYELAVRSAEVGIWDWDLRTGKVYYSPRWKEIFGYEADEIGEGMDEWASRLHPDERETLLEQQDEFLASNLSHATVEYRFRHKDGSYRWIVAHVLAVRDEQGKAYRLVGSHGDITTRKRAEEAVRQNEARYKALVESCPDAVAMCDLQGRIVFASPRAAEQHGIADPDDLIGVPVKNLVVEQDRERFEANVQRLIQEGIRRDDQYLGIRHDGSTFEAEVSAAVIRNAEGQPEALMGIYRDISDRRQVEENLRAKDAELFVAAEIQSRLLPQQAPEIPGFDIARHCYPAEAAAGDHFDFLVWPDGSLRLVVGDVSGHNLGSAILAADFCARVRMLSELRYGLADMAANMNAALHCETAGETFVTAILAHLHADSRTLSYVNAGHPPIIIFDATGRVKARLGSDGLPLAILAETPFYTHPPFPLASGDLVLFFTDGLIEVHRYGKPLFGIERAIEVVQENRERSAAEIIEALYRAACQYAGVEKPKDDITVVIVKVLTPKAESATVREQRDDDETEPVAADRSAAADSVNTPLFDVRQSGGVTVVRPVNMRSFDADDYAEFQREFLGFVERQRPRKLLVDLSRIEYCSTAFINALLMAQRRLKAEAGIMKLFGAGQVMLETLHHLKLVGTLFQLDTDETSARNGF